VQWYCVVLEFIDLTATVDIVQWYWVVCGVYFGDSKSRYSAMVLFYFGDYCGYRKSRCSARILCCFGFIVVTTTVVIVQ